MEVEVGGLAVWDHEYFGFLSSLVQFCEKDRGVVTLTGLFFQSNAKKRG